MFRRFKFIYIAFAAVFSLSACENIIESKPQMVASPDRISLMLAEAADRSAKALETLSAIEQYQNPEVSVAPIENAPAELNRAVTTNWIGPVDVIVKSLADKAGYGFMVMGDEPPVPIIVSIDVENRRIIDVLRDIGLQMGTRADVRVNDKYGMIEVQYAPVVGISGY